MGLSSMLDKIPKISLDHCLLDAKSNHAKVSNVNTTLVRERLLSDSNLKHSQISNSFQEIHGVGAVVEIVYNSLKLLITADSLSGTGLRKFSSVSFGLLNVCKGLFCH